MSTTHGRARWRALAALLPLVTLAVVGLAQPAAAHTAPTAQTSGIGVMGCQQTSFVLIVSNNLGAISMNCSGYHDVENYRIDRFTAGGWSGVFTYGTGRWKWHFCDWDTGGLGGQIVWDVTLSPTKASWC